MNNKNCGCQPGNGFVPVSGNWDFNMDGCQSRRRNACEKAETGYQRGARADVCSVCGKPRNACTCGRNNCAREDVCSVCGKPRNACTCGRSNCAREDVCSVCGKPRNACTCGRNNCAREDVCSVCGKPRNACTCGQNACIRMVYDACPEEKNAPACVMKTAESARGAKKGVGIVRVTKQALNDIYDNARALKAGTLFPELHKPMNGYWPCENECGDGCQQAAFAAWEVRLYLDTHPDDVQARALLQQLVGECCEPNYATTFLTENCARWTWTDDPWPWNVDANRCK